MSAELEATTAPVATPPPAEQSPEAQAVVLTTEAVQNLIKADILQQFAAIGADAAVVHIPNLEQQTTGHIITVEYSAEIGSGPHPWFLETGTVTINEGEVTHSPEKYFGRQIFATSSDLDEITTDSTSQTPHPYPIYANDTFTQLDPGDFFSAGPPTFPGTKILELAPDIQTDVSEPDNSFKNAVEPLPRGEGTKIKSIETNGEEGGVRILEIEIENPTPAELIYVVGCSIKMVAHLELTQYHEPKDPIGFYSREPLFVAPPHIKKTRSNLTKVRIKAI